MSFFCDLRVLAKKFASRFATQRKSVRKFNLRPIATTCRSVWPNYVVLLNKTQLVASREAFITYACDTWEFVTFCKQLMQHFSVEAASSMHLLRKKKNRKINKQKFQRKWLLKLDRHFTNPTPSSQTLRKSLVKKTGKVSTVLRRPYLFLTREFTSCSGWSCYCDLSCRFLFFCTVYIVVRLTDTISWSESLLCILWKLRVIIAVIFFLI